MKKQIDFNSLPQAIADLYEKVENIEKLIIKLSEKLDKPVKKPAKAKPNVLTEEKVTVIKTPSPSGMDEDSLTVEQASAFLQMTRMNIYAHVKLSKIPHWKNGRRLVFSKIELEEWMKKKRKTDANNTKDAITFRDAVKLTGLKPSKLQYEIKKRKVPVIAKQGNLLYYSKRALTKALTSE
ncbi:MAG TPA: helix-turn-helix domain-containing protein [Bacteroidales bacterium]|nr:helix-turn-helix domain-containing protein [Bacteroidales bacterium]